MNKHSLNARRMSPLLAGLAVLLLSACATTPPAEKTVEERAMARWNALLGDDVAVAYEYFSPGYRSSVSLKQYQRSLLLMKLRWNGVEYIGSDCVETTCKVKISLKYTVFGAVPGLRSFNGNQIVGESWLLTGGEWYLVPKK